MIADLFCVVIGMVMRVWMTMWNSTRTGITVAMRRISMLMRSEQVPRCAYMMVFFLLSRLHFLDDAVQRRTWAMQPFTGHDEQ